MNSIFNFITAKASFVVILLMMCVQSLAQSETSYQPLPFLEGNPIWVYKYEHISMPRDPNLKCWVDTGNRSFTYYFLGGQKEIDGKVYTMMGEIISKGEDNITFRCWLPVREENGVVYTLTDSLLYVCEHEHTPRSRDELPYIQQGDECVLYNFCAEIGEKLSPKDGNSAVESIDTYQLMDGTVCRVLKTIQGYQLCEKLGYLDFNLPLGIMAPYLSMVVPTNGHVYVDRLNAFFGDNMMLYKAPDAQEGLCVNDTCWTREAASAYARSYKADPYQEKVFSYIRQLQMATGIVEIKNGILKMNHEGTLFDLQGRKLSGKPARGIYIEDGKKKVK